MNGEPTKMPAHMPIDMSTQNGSVSRPNTMFGVPSFLLVPHLEQRRAQPLVDVVREVPAHDERDR